MGSIRLSRINLLSLFMFLVSPIVGLVYSFFKINGRSNRRFFYLICSSFFAIVFLKNAPIHDAYRYYDRFNNTLKVDDIGFYTQDYFFDLIAIAFNYLGVSFYYIPSLFIFLTLFFSFLALEVLIRKYNFDQKTQLFLILSIVILSNPIMISMGLRSYLAFSFLFYAIILFSHSESRCSYFFLVLSIFTHASFIIFSLPFLLLKFYNPNKIIVVIFSAILLISSSFFVEKLTQIKFINIIFGDLLGYSQFDNLENKSARGLFFYYTVLYLKLFFIYYTYIRFDLKKANSNQKKMYGYIGYMIIICSICSVSEVALGRYTTYAAFLIFFLFFIVRLKTINFFKIDSLVLIFFLMFNFLILNLYVNRSVFYTGKPVQMSLLTPLNLILYSKEEYDKYLIDIDIDGYPKASLGQE